MQGDDAGHAERFGESITSEFKAYLVVVSRANEEQHSCRAFTVSPTEVPHRSRSVTGQGKPDSIVREFCDYVRQGGNIE